MAPEKNPEVKAKQLAREITLWSQCKKNTCVPKNYVSLHSAQRNFGISYKVLLKLSHRIILSYTYFNQDLQHSELREVIYGTRCGQYGYFLAPEVGCGYRDYHSTEKMLSDVL